MLALKNHYKSGQRYTHTHFDMIDISLIGQQYFNDLYKQTRDINETPK